MKKTILSVALAVAACAFASAQAPQQQTTAKKAEATNVAQQDEYKDVKIETLTPKVQEAVKAFEKTCTVKSIGFNETKKLTKVTLVSKADKSEKVAILDETGKEVK